MRSIFKFGLGIVLGGSVITTVVKGDYGPQPAGGGTGGTFTPAKVTPGGCTASIISVGGTAVTLVTGPVSGGYIYNGANATQQGGIAAAETLYLDPVTIPGSTDGAANGTTYPDGAGGIFNIPPLANGVVLKGNSATSGHKLTCVVW